MSKVYKFNKYFYSFIFSMISLSIFIIDFKAYNPFFLRSDSALVNFFVEFEHSIKSFDIIYVTLWLFILYFYCNVYFDGKKYDKKSLFCTIISVIFAIITILCKSFSIDDTLNTLYSSTMQVFKTIIFSFGYYFIYYALLKKLLNIKIDSKKVKKKAHLLQGK